MHSPACDRGACLCEIPVERVQRPSDTRMPGCDAMAMLQEDATSTIAEVPELVGRDIPAG